MYFSIPSHQRVSGFFIALMSVSLPAFKPAGVQPKRLVYFILRERNFRTNWSGKTHFGSQRVTLAPAPRVLDAMFKLS